MRVAALALIALAGLACSGRTLQADGGDGVGSIPLDGGPNATDGGAGGVCGMSTITGGYLPIDIVVLLDQSVSGDRSKWTELLGLLTSQMVGSGNRFDWGLYAFPEAGPACGAGTVTADVDVPVTPFNAEAVAVAIGATNTTGEGSPTAVAIAAGAAHLRTLPIDHPKALMLVTDGAPSCAGTIGALAADAARAQTEALAAIADALAAEVLTIVVGPSTTAASDVGALNALAEAGGVPYGQGDIKFLTEKNLFELFIPVGDGRSCLYRLDSPPPAPDAVTVTLNGSNVPRDRTRVNGWEYSDELPGGIELYGGWCDSVVASRSFEIVVLYGCSA